MAVSFFLIDLSQIIIQNCRMFPLKRQMTSIMLLKPYELHLLCPKARSAAAISSSH